MADNSVLSTPIGSGDTIRDIDKGGVKTQVVTLDLGGAGVESLVAGSIPVTASTLPLPTGASTAAKQDTGNTSLSSIDGKLTSGVSVSGTVNANLNAGSNLIGKVGIDQTTPGTTNAVSVTNSFALEASRLTGLDKEQVYDPNFAQSAMIDTHRGVRISEIVRIFGDSFSDGIGSGDDFGTFPTTVTITSTGTGGVANGQLSFRTGSSNVAASSTLQSLKTHVHLSGALAGFQSGIQFPTTPTTWKIVSRKSGVDTAVLSGSFNGTANTPDGNFHRYEVWYQGAGSAKFMVDGVLLHSLSGQPNAVRTLTLDFPIRYELDNASGSTVARAGMFDTQNGYFFEAVYTAADLTMNCRASSALRLGPAAADIGRPPVLAKNASQETGGNLASILGVLQNILTINQNLLTELRILNTNVCSGLNVKDTPEFQREDYNTLN